MGVVVVVVYLSCVEDKLSSSRERLCHEHKILERRAVVDNASVVVEDKRLLTNIITHQLIEMLLLLLCTLSLRLRICTPSWLTASHRFLGSVRV